MCGIVGIAGHPGRDPERRAAVLRMAGVLAHRGPDGAGDADRDGCALGFQRLAIVDVAGATPPFPNESESVWSICNGEIYNSDALRAELIGRGHRFRTGVDTEVIPHLYEEFGSGLVERLDGMFALAVWDEPRRLLLLARDRAGEKPMFYRVHRGELAFASELRAFVEHPDGPLAVDPVALSRYLLHDYFPAPLTPLAGVRKLPAGHLLTWQGGEATVRRYWDLAGYFGRTVVKSEREVAAEVDALLGQAVRRRKKSDVPVGVFLSGGLDSSTVLAHLSEQEGKGVPVFALGHRDPAFDESRYARETAAFFGAEFHELILDEADLEEGLQRITAGFDEPLGDASIIPTHLLALFARRQVKVVLSGEGGDELFAGYPTYAADRVAEIYRRIPGPLRRGAIGGLRALLPVQMGNNGLDYLLSRFAQGAERERVERHHCWFGSLTPERQAPLFSPALRAGPRRRRSLRLGARRGGREGPPRRAVAAALHRLHDVPGGRPADQGGPGDDARLARGPRPVPRPRAGRVRRRPPLALQGPAGHREVDPARGGAAPPAAGRALPPQARLHDPVLALAAARPARPDADSLRSRAGPGPRSVRSRRRVGAAGRSPLPARRPQEGALHAAVFRPLVRPRVR